MINLYNRKIILILMISIIGLISCVTTTPVCLTSSNIPLNDKKISENLGRTSGTSGFTSSILGLWMIGRPDMEEAITDAINNKEADAIINIKCYETYYWLVIWGLTKVTVEGEAVKFEK